MIGSILIANRGEIAVRVARACRELGIRSVVAFSEADRGSLAVRLADDAVCIGPPAARDSYLKPSNIISAALLTRCDAIHPGVGFLSENASFARAVSDAGLIFIGPRAETIARVGDKVEARRTAVENGIPVTPGSDGGVAGADSALEIAASIGYPIIVKAASGGGGKGMRICRDPKELSAAIGIASAEAQAAFADGTVYLERYLERPRHVEVQVLADSHGTVLHLGERDCSVQRNHQKLLEECPSPAVGEAMRASMGADAIRLFSALEYVGAGTIEFLVENDRYYFMEVNARVQVEHPVSELVTGVDIIAEQIRAAAGEPLTVSQEDATVSGYALEARINALGAGTVTRFVPPGGYGVRTDSYLFPGAVVPPHYDSLVAKVIVSATTRHEGIARMLRALGELEIEGIPTNAAEQAEIVASSVFRSGDFGTDALARIERERAA